MSCRRFTASTRSTRGGGCADVALHGHLAELGSCVVCHFHCPKEAACLCVVFDPLISISGCESEDPPFLVAHVPSARSAFHASAF